MKSLKDSWVGWGLTIIFCIRLLLSLIIYNADIDNHQAWMSSVVDYGWTGLYERDMGERAPVNYPPLTLYSFWLGEKLYELLPLSSYEPNLHAFFYKLPSLIADIAVAWLIWSHTKFKRKTKLLMMLIYLFSPALIYNSVWWGQVESMVTFFSIGSLIFFARGKDSYALILFALAVLSKQNVLPLIPVALFSLVLNKTSPRKLIGAMMVIASMVFFFYLPLTPPGNNVFVYAAKNYIGSIGGQSHQHESTVNALNFWYLRGGNYTSDSTVFVSGITDRQTGLILTFIGVIISLYYYYKFHKKDKYLAVFLSGSFLMLWTFVFATRMHERHGYMGIALLTFLLPYMRTFVPYGLLNFISYYNLYAVWQQYFYYHYGNTWWNLWFKFLSLVTVITMLTFPYWILSKRFFSKYLHEHRIKSNVVNSS